MSRTVDERIVSMQFDNANFEKNVSQSMSTLDKLKQKLNLSDASKGFENISSAAKSVTLTPMASAIENVGLKFSALYSIADQTMRRITDSVLNTATKMASAFTTEPIKAGLSEYETQINAVQTILANTQNKGTTLEDVNGALDELNKYADKTIYNFTEMTRNIGTFTAAGVDLDTSVTAIQGIANLAAVSGSTSQQASTAMYQLSQALATGTVKLMDWNSVVNAGMGGQVFQDALKKTARAHGVAVDEIIKKNGSFRDSLQEGWLTSEILTETLGKMTKSGAAEYLSELTGIEQSQIEAAQKAVDTNKDGTASYEALAKELAKTGKITKDEAIEILNMADTAEDAATKVKTFTQLMDTLKEAAQSGWTQTWELLIGDFEEAKELWTSVSDVFSEIINASAEVRNKILEGALGKSFKSLMEPLNGLKKTVSSISEPIKTVTKTLEDYNTVVNEVIGGKWDYGQNRFDALTEAGYDWMTVQNMVNEELGLSKKYQTDFVIGQESATKATEETTEADAEYIAKLTEMSDAQLESLGLTQKQIDSIKEIKSQSDKLGLSVEDFINNIDEIDGRWILINSFKNMWAGLTQVFETIKAAWEDIFPPKSVEERSEKLYNLIAAFHKFTAKLKMSDETADKLKRTFKGLFAIVDIITTIVGGALKVGIKVVSKLLNKTGTGVLDLTAKIGDMIVKFHDWLFENEIINTVLEKVAEHVTKVIKTISKWIDAFKNLSIVQNIIEKIKSVFTFDDVINETQVTGTAVEKLTGTVRTASDKLKSFSSAIINFSQSAIDKVKELASAIKRKLPMPGFEAFLAIMGGIWKIMQIIGSKIAEISSSIGSALMDAVRSGDVNAVLDVLNGGLFAAILLGIKKFVGGIAEVSNSVGGAFGQIKDILNSVKGCLEAYQQVLQAKTLLKIASAIAILAAAIVVISLIDPAKLTNSLGAVTVLFADLMGSLALFSKMSGSLKNAMKTRFTMIALSIAVLILASALKKIASLDTDGLSNGLIGVALLSAIVVIAAKKMSTDTKKVMKGALSLIGFAVAINILASAVKKLSVLNWEELAKGLVGVGVLMAGVSLFLNNTKFSVKAIFTATGMVILAAAIKILASACGTFGDMNWGQIIKGLASIGALLLELAIFTNLTGNAKHVISTGLSLVLIAASVHIFASAIQSFAAMSPGEIAKGLITMAVALAAITAAVNFMPKNMLGIGTGLLIVSAAIMVLTSSLTKLSGLGWKEIARGLVALGGAMAILAIGLNFMSGTIGGSAALLVAAIALGVLTPVLMLLGSMGLPEIGKALLVLAGVFVILGVAATALSPLVPVILALAAAVLLLGLSCLSIGAGLTMISIALTTLAASGVAIASAITAIIVGIISGIGAGIIAMAKTIAEGAPAIMAAVVSVLTSIIAAIVIVIPSIVVLITSILTTLATYAPTIMEQGMRLILAILKGIRDHIGEVTVVAIQIVCAFVDGIASQIKPVVDCAFNLIISFINGLANSLRDNVDKVTSAVENLCSAIIEAAIKVLLSGVKILITTVKNILGIHSPSTVFNSIGKYVWQGLVNGLKSGINNIKNIAKRLIDALIKGFKSKVSSVVKTVAEIPSKCVEKIKTFVNDFKTAAGNCIEGFTKGIKNKISGAVEGVKSLGSKVVSGLKNVLGIHSPSKVFAELGEYSGQGYIEGLTSTSGDAEEAAKDYGSGIIDGINDGLDLDEIDLSSVTDSFSDLEDVDLSNLSDVDLSNLSNLSGGDYSSLTDLMNASTDYAKTATGSTNPNFEESTDIDDAWPKTLKNTDGLKEALENAVDYEELVRQYNYVAKRTMKGKYGTGEERIENYKKLFPELDPEIIQKIVNEMCNDSSYSITEDDLKNLGVEVPMNVSVNDLYLNPLWEWLTDEANNATSVEEIENLANELISFLEDKGVTITDGFRRQLAEQTKTLTDNIRTTFTDEELLEIDYNAEKNKSIDNYTKLIESLGPNASDVDKVAAAVAEHNIKSKLIQDEIDKLDKDADDYQDKLNELDLKRQAEDAAFKEALKSNGLENGQSEYFSDLQSIINEYSSLEAYINSKYGDLLSSDAFIKVSEYMDSISDTEELIRKGYDDFFEIINDENMDPEVKMARIDGLLEAMIDLCKQYDEQVAMLAEAMNVDPNTIGKSSVGYWSSMYDSFKDMMESMEDGLIPYDEYRNFEIWFKNLDESLLPDTDFSGITNETEQIGSYIVQGAIDGIQASMPMLKESIKEVAETVLETFSKKVEIASPSKMFYRYGGYIVQGLCNGLKVGRDSVKDAATIGLVDAVNKVIDFFNSDDIDVQPTITPVLDLSDLEAGANNISSLFGNGMSLGLMSNLSAINSSMNNQNGDRNDVVKAIGELRNDIKNIKNNTYTVNGITYDDGSAVSTAVKSIIRAAKIERRV